MFKILYPQGKPKAFNITYDDGVLQDVRFVNLLNQYGLKGTFNLNTKLMEDEFEWTHSTGRVIKRLSRETAVKLYEGHEIASHTLTHPNLQHLSREEMIYELSEDKKRLEEWFGCEVKGFAVPFDYYDELGEECVKACGFQYARISKLSNSYKPWEDFYNWRAGMYHVIPEFPSFVEGFFEAKEELAFCQIVGHSYDLDTRDMWEQMEAILKRVSEDDSILPMTHGEVVGYLRALQEAQVTDYGIANHSEQELWFEVDEGIISVKPGEIYNWIR